MSDNQIFQIGRIFDSENQVQADSQSFNFFCLGQVCQLGPLIICDVGTTS